MSTKVYTKNHCPYCDMAKQLLSEKGVSFVEININHSERPEEIIQEISSFTKQKTFPQIILDDQYIGGYTDLRDHYYQIES